MKLLSQHFIHNNFVKILRSSNISNNPIEISTKKRLMKRLVVASTITSILLSSIVFYLEYRRLGQLVTDRATEIVSRFNNEIRVHLNFPVSTNKTAIQSKLKILSIIGQLNHDVGQIVYAGIFDLKGNAIAVEKDSKNSHLKALNVEMDSFEPHQLPPTKKLYQYKYMSGISHIQLIYPLFNSNKEKVVYIKALFAISSQTRNKVLFRIVRSILGTISIVFLTTIILYPIIMSLVAKLSSLTDNLLESNIETLRVLGNAIAKRDSDTDIHNYRVSIYSVTLAEAYGLQGKLIRSLIKGAFLHDVGKIGISDKILLKPGKLTEKEFDIMKRHVSHGIDIIENSVWLKDAQDVVEYHHEKFNGSGYPNGIKGYSIPVIARIFAIVDVFDALTSVRPYKDQIPLTNALEILENDRGTHFDPSILDTFISIVNPLYDRVSESSDKDLRANLEIVTRKYFSKAFYADEQ